MKKSELIFIPLPQTGHLSSTFMLAKRLINLDPRISMMTILCMKLPFAPNADAFLASLTASEPRIRHISLPKVVQDTPTTTETTDDDFLALVDKNMPSIRKTIQDLISSSPESSPVAGLVLDFFCVDMIDMARVENIPCYVFMTANLAYLGFLRYLPERHRLTPSEFDLSSDEKEFSIPVFKNKVPAKVIPPGVFDELYYKAFVNIGQRLHEAKGILVNSFSDAEPYAAEHFSRGGNINYPRVYPIGPVLDLTGRTKTQPQYREMMKWLDEQPAASVLLLCFGSMGVFSAPQIKEIAHALELVGVRFIWAIRTGDGDDPHDEALPEGFADRTMGRGIVCSWAPQVDILAHKATGGFVSHCGWNSIQESLWYGVPIATWPMYAEQQLNAFEMVKELGLAVEIRLDYVADDGGNNATLEIVSAEEIAAAVRSLMSDDVIRKKVKEVSAMARKALGDGGSSMVATRDFIRDVLGDHV